MSTASKLGAAFGAALLGLVLLSNPAMADPDGKKQNGTEATENDAAPGSADREVEAGGSGTQGRSESNPDSEGVDKPYAAAGRAAQSQGPSDYDGNNGCGNDTDFADDNNGKCGRSNEGDDDTDVKDDDDTDVKDGDDTDVKDGDETAAPAATAGAQVMGIQIERASVSPAAAPQPAAGSAQVLGVQLERSAPAALAATGLPLALLALVGLGLVGGGTALRRWVRA